MKQLDLFKYLQSKEKVIVKHACRHHYIHSARITSKEVFGYIKEGYRVIQKWDGLDITDLYTEKGYQKPKYIGAHSGKKYTYKGKTYTIA